MFVDTSVAATTSRCSLLGPICTPPWSGLCARATFSPRLCGPNSGRNVCLVQTSHTNKGARTGTGIRATFCHCRGRRRRRGSDCIRGRSRLACPHSFGLKTRFDGRCQCHMVVSTPYHDIECLLTSRLSFMLLTYAVSALLVSTIHSFNWPRGARHVPRVSVEI